jgi:hypothetical protein
MYASLSHFIWCKACAISNKLCWFAFLLSAPCAIAQSNVGQLLDMGAQKLTTEQFKEELVQRVIVGPTATEATLELIYASTGAIQGRAFTPQEAQTFANLPPIDGDWTVGENGSICTRMTIGKASLPYRCQFWFKYADHYFLADSDSDRRARVLRRDLKQ